MFALKAIETKYHGPTNFRGSRITARAEGGHHVTVSYPHQLSGAACHAYAARQLAEKLGWAGKWHVGGLPKGGYVFVLVCGPVDGHGTEAFTVAEKEGK